MKRTKSIPFLLAPFLLASSAMAQLTDWHAVQALPGGTKIHVTLKHGRTFGHCFFQGAPDDELVCSYRGGLYSRRVVYPRDNIKAVYRAHNGPAIGLGIGAGAGAVIGASRDPVPGLGRGGTALVDAGILGGLGAFLGLIADPFFHGRAVYRDPNPDNVAIRSSTPKEQHADQLGDKIPCLRDGVTLQCVP